MKQLDRSDLYPYQLEGVDFITREPNCLLHMEIGSGKTVTTATALASMGAIPALIVATKRVAEQVWRQELAKWTHLCDLKVSVVVGKPGHREAALVDRADVYVINYGNLQWLMERYWLNIMQSRPRPPADPRERYVRHLCDDLKYTEKRAKLVASKIDYSTVAPFPDFKAIVWDEISKMKSRGAQYKAVRKWAKSIPVRIGLTGTPVGNSMLGIWGQVDLIRNEQPLRRSFTRYKTHWFYPTDYNGYNWAPKPDAASEIRKAIAGFTYKLDAGDYTTLPDLVELDINVELPPTQQRQYKQMQKQLALELGVDEIVVAANMAVGVNKLRQIAAGGIYGDTHVDYLHERKLEALDELVEGLQGAPLLLFYEFKFQRDAVLSRYGDAVAEISTGTIQMFNTGNLPILLAHPASAGHGLQLQGASNHVCFMSCPWSMELYTQAIGRLRRTGQNAQTVFCHRIITLGTVDEEIVTSLARLESDEKNFIDMRTA